MVRDRVVEDIALDFDCITFKQSEQSEAGLLRVERMILEVIHSRFDGRFRKQ